METSPKMFWLVLLFNIGLAVDAYKKGHNLFLVVLCIALTYAVPLYLSSLYREYKDRKKPKDPDT